MDVACATSRPTGESTDSAPSALIGSSAATAAAMTREKRDLDLMMPPVLSRNG
jgi:hypothetical protein